MLLEEADEVEFYRIPPELENSFLKIETSEERKKITAYQILTGDDAAFIKDPIAMEALNKDYVHYAVTPNQLTRIAKQFAGSRHPTDKASFSLSSSVCEPFYRDILIFKKDSEIIFIAKICLECHKFSFYSEPPKVIKLNIDFEQLEKVLNEVANSKMH